MSKVQVALRRRRRGTILPFEDTSKNWYTLLLLTSHCQDSLVRPHLAAGDVGNKICCQGTNEPDLKLRDLLLSMKEEGESRCWGPPAVSATVCDPTGTLVI